MIKVFYTLIVFVLATFSNNSLANSEGEAMYSALGCASCHGSNGRSNDESIPSLAGKEVEWIIQQLKYFQSGERQNSYMNAMAPMAEGFERSIAEYLSIQDPQR
jgi:cytochrome c553